MNVHVGQASNLTLISLQHMWQGKRWRSAFPPGIQAQEIKSLAPSHLFDSAHLLTRKLNPPSPSPSPSPSQRTCPRPHHHTLYPDINIHQLGRDELSRRLSKLSLSYNLVLQRLSHCDPLFNSIFPFCTPFHSHPVSCSC